MKVLFFGSKKMKKVFCCSVFCIIACLASASLAQTNYFDPPVGGIEYQAGNILNDFIKPLVNHHKDDILDSLGIFPPTSIEEGIDWFSEHPIGGGIIIGGVVGSAIIGIETGLIDSIPLPAINIPTFTLPNGGTLSGTITGKIGIDDNWNIGDTYSFGFNFEFKY